MTKNIEKPRYYSLSLSGGKDSTAMALEWVKRHKLDPVNYPLDEIVYYDTGLEFPAMVEHINNLEKLFIEQGIKFKRLKPDNTFWYYLLEHWPKFTDKAKYRNQGYGWPGTKSRWCTAQKTNALNRHNKELKNYQIIHLVGIAADETYRLDRANNKKEGQKHPLVEWG